MDLELITPPPFMPVTLAQCYSHLRLDPDGSPATHTDDALLTVHIGSATGEAEKYTRRAFIRQSLRLHVARFPCSGRGIKLPRPPLQSVQSVRYYDADNVLQTVDPASYYVSQDGMPQVRFVKSFVRPEVYDRPDAVRVDYTVGYEHDNSPPTVQQDYAANVPYEVKAGILLGVQLLYDTLTPDQREKLERARTALLQPLQVTLAV